MTSPLISKILFASLGLAALCAAGAASAADPNVGPYVGLSAGSGVTSLKKGGIDSAIGAQGAQVSSGHSDTQDTTYNLNLGYRITPNFAVEAGYVNLGKYGYQSNLSGSAGAVNGEFKSHGLTAAGVGIVPLGRGFSAYGKLGLIEARTELTASGAGVGNSTHSSTGLLAGLGASYDITPSIAGTAEWNRYNNLGDASTAYGAVNTYTLGVKYKF